MAATAGRHFLVRARPDNQEDPFAPLAIWENKRTASIDDLDEEHLNSLEQISEIVRIPELGARVADVLFVRRKHHRFGKVAIDAYLAAATALSSPERWHETFVRLERAYAIAILVRSERERVTEFLTRELDAHKGDATFFSARIMRCLADYRSGDPKTMAALSEASVLKAKADRDWHRAREYLLLAALWHRKLGNGDAEIRAIRDAAECYVQLADQMPSPSVQVSHLERAVQSLRSISGTQGRVEELHGRIVLLGKAAVAEFKGFEHSIDVSESVRAARAAVRTTSVEDAVVKMATLWRPRPVAELREKTLEMAGQSAFVSSIQRTIVNRSGKVVARRGPLLGGEPAKQEETIRQAMFEYAAQARQLIADSVLRAARSQIAEEHYISTRVLLLFTSRSAFVPFGRAELFAQGLAAGFGGDFATALHILIPQIENSIRVLLDQIGVITSSISSDGIQDERDLGSLLYVPETARIFDEALLFEMQGLLVERFGSNLRNRFAHGLLDIDQCVDGQSVYLWWLTLFLVVMPVLGAAQRAAGGENTSEGQPPGQLEC